MKETKPIRILLADDHSLMRVGLSSLIASESDMTVVGEAENGAEAVIKSRELKPDVVIMDLSMPKMSGAEATRVIRSELPNTRILILTTFGTSADLAIAVSNGADSILLKDTTTDDLIETIRNVAAGKKHFSKKTLAIVKEDSSMSRLTERQLEILGSITRGLTNLDIAKQFGISEIGVKKHLSAIFAKLDVSNRSEAIAIALRKHLLKT